MDAETKEIEGDDNAASSEETQQERGTQPSQDDEDAEEADDEIINEFLRILPADELALTQELAKEKQTWTDKPPKEKAKVRRSRKQYMREYRKKKQTLEAAEQLDVELAKLRQKDSQDSNEEFRLLVFKKAMEEDNPKWAELWERLSREDRRKDTEYSLTADDLFRIRREAQDRVSETTSAVSVGRNGN